MDLENIKWSWIEIHLKMANCERVLKFPVTTFLRIEVDLRSASSQVQFASLSQLVILKESNIQNTYDEV